MIRPALIRLQFLIATETPMPYPGQRPHRPRKHLVDDWRQSWRWLSVQMSWAAGALSAAIITAAPGLAVDMLTAPLGQRIAFAILIAAAVIVLPWLARILKQKPRGCE